MPEGVVDLLEAIEIENQQADEASVSLCGKDGLLCPVVEEVAIGKVSQRIVHRKMLTLGCLVTQACRRAGDDPEQRDVEENQAAREEEIQTKGVGGDCRRDRAIGQIELERTGRRR